MKPADIIDNILQIKIMGILNITPDSFSDGGINSDIESALITAREMVAAGVFILDVGGESTRPGSQPVTQAEELHRVIPVIEALRYEFPEIPISIDTYKSGVASEALESGANWVNDISGGTFSPEMFDIAAKHDAKVVISHIKGTPRNMQKNPWYDNVVGEICEWLIYRAEQAENSGIPHENIIIDPGIGFGKRFKDNITILRNIDSFKSLDYALMIGTSRKSWISNSSPRALLLPFDGRSGDRSVIDSHPGNSPLCL